MLIPVERDLDYLAARLHGWRSRIAEGSQLDELCHVRTVAELVRRIKPEVSFQQAVPFQRHLIQAHAEELSTLAESIEGPGADYLRWQQVRLQVENLKVLARGLVNKLQLEQITAGLVELPGELALDLESLADPWDDDPLARLLNIIPEGALREAIRDSEIDVQKKTALFRIEALLDRTYLQKLLHYGTAIRGEDGPSVVKLSQQEVDRFNQMLVMRGRHHYELPCEILEPLFVEGGKLRREDFAAFLNTEDAAQGMRMLASTFYLLELPVVEAALLETLGWNRYLRLANALFRQSQMSLGVVIGFVAIRRIELANLITLSEGMRLGLSPQKLRQMLIPRAVMEEMHV